MHESQFKFKNEMFLVPIAVLITIWLVYFIEIQFNLNFNKFGIYPQTISGLKGVFLSSFIHSDAKHLFNNSMPLVVMLGALYYFYHKIAHKVLLFGMLLSGILTWSFARPSFHIGASGVVYFLVSFIFFSGIIRKYYRLIALSLAVVFLYGSMVWYIFPIEERISWEGHLSGFVVGLIFAFAYRKIGPQPKVFQFTKNEEFENLFDENGNFNPPIIETNENKDENEI